MHSQRSVGQLVAEAKLEREAKSNVKSAHSEDTKIYRQYLAAVNGAVDGPLPLQTHQVVLRACTPHRDAVRAHVGRLLEQDELDWRQVTHPYESRFQKIIENITSAGFNPTIDDYHFVMFQLAAVGHYTGIRKYMRHMGRIGLGPDQQTFGYFLQAIAHRVSLPIPSLERAGIVRNLVNTAIKAIREMVSLRIPPSSANLDLAFRVLSEVYDPQGIAELLQLGYGMDLSYLDSPPIDGGTVSTTPAAEWLPQTLPFSTNALNSLLEPLGRWGQISKMVYVFETLTNPLPVPVKPDNTFDDDDDDFFPIQQEWKPPSALPNTTSFNLLIKHSIAHGHPWLAKHYTMQMIHEEHMGTLRLRDELRKKPSSEVAAPRVAVSGGTLRPIQGFANRFHDIETLKWFIWMCKRAARIKYRSWTFYDQNQSKYDSQPTPTTSDTPDSLEPPPSSSTSPPLPSLRKTFRVSKHLYILKQDIAAITRLRWTAENRLFESVAKQKARMGRRIWKGKNVYMKDEGTRVSVDPEQWKQKVNFMVSKQRVVEPKPRPKKYLGKHFDPVVAAARSQKF